MLWKIKNMEEQISKIGAGAVIIKDGMTLLAKRRGSHGSGMWGSMGGHVEFGESPIETVKREAKEELGIEIGNVQFAVCTDMIIGGKHFLDVSFTAEIISGEPKNQEPEKIETLGWYSLDDLPSPLFPPIENVFKAIKTGQKYFEVRK